MKTFGGTKISLFLGHKTKESIYQFQDLSEIKIFDWKLYQAINLGAGKDSFLEQKFKFKFLEIKSGWNHHYIFNKNITSVFPILKDYLYQILQ